MKIATEIMLIIRMLEIQEIAFVMLLALNITTLV